MEGKAFHSPIALISLSLLSATFFFFILPVSASPDPIPAPWPIQFHSIIFMNTSDGLLQVVDLWYDWPNGRNLNILQNQLGKKMYHVEWTNGTTYYFTLDEEEECETRHVSVGILRPNWLDGANYLGRVYKDGFLCNVWEKLDFIWYYEDVETKRPVYWSFYTGVVEHVITFEVGKVLDDQYWQAPPYCFEKDDSNNKKEKKKSSSLEFQFGLSLQPMGSLIRDKFQASGMVI